MLLCAVDVDADAFSLTVDAKVDMPPYLLLPKAVLLDTGVWCFDIVEDDDVEAGDCDDESGALMDALSAEESGCRVELRSVDDASEEEDEDCGCKDRGSSVGDREDGDIGCRVDLIEIGEPIAGTAAADARGESYFDGDDVDFCGDRVDTSSCICKCLARVIGPLYEGTRAVVARVSSPYPLSAKSEIVRTNVRWV